MYGGRIHEQSAQDVLKPSESIKPGSLCLPRMSRLFLLLKVSVSHQARTTLSALDEQPFFLLVCPLCCLPGCWLAGVVDISAHGSDCMPQLLVTHCFLAQLV